MFSPVNGEPFLLENSVLQKAGFPPKALFIDGFVSLREDKNAKNPLKLGYNGTSYFFFSSSL